MRCAGLAFALLAAAPAAASEPLAFAGALACGAEQVLVGIGEYGLTMEARGERYELAPAAAASGARHETPETFETWFWSHGETARVSVRGELLPECVVARLPEPEFRAGGNEPGWSFVFDKGRLTLSLDYGAERREAPAPAPGLSDGAVVIVSSEIGATIRIEPRICRDAATGMPHPNTVNVETGGRTLSGCGGRPFDLLGGVEWKAQSVGAVSTTSRKPTLVFEAEGRVSGIGSCNRYMASYALTGEGLSFSPLAGTFMACGKDLMEQEALFADAMTRVARFDVVDGALILLDQAGETSIRAEP